jgi:hypothetical protein
MSSLLYQSRNAIPDSDCLAHVLFLKFQKFHHRNDTREVIVQTGVIGICGRWPLAAPLLIVSRLPFIGGEGGLPRMWYGNTE